MCFSSLFSYVNFYEFWNCWTCKKYFLKLKVERNYKLLFELFIFLWMKSLVVLKEHWKWWYLMVAFLWGFWGGFERGVWIFWIGTLVRIQEQTTHNFPTIKYKRSQSFQSTTYILRRLHPIIDGTYIKTMHVVYASLYSMGLW